MKASFAKALGLLLVLALTLSGCNLIAVDHKMQADEDIAKIDKAYAQVVATYDGGDVTVGEVMGDFNAMYNETAEMYYYYYGMEMTHEDVHMLAEDVLAERVKGEIMAAKFDAEYGFTDEELAAEEENVRYTADSYQQSAMEMVEGKDEKTKVENARVLLRESGVDYDSLYNAMILYAKQMRMEEILRGEVTEVSEEELQAAYEAKIAEQQSLYTDGYSFESDMSYGDVTVCWKPDGYRTVKHILLIPDEELTSAYTDAQFNLEMTQSDIEYLEEERFAAEDDDIAEGERTAEEIQAEIDAIQTMLPDLEEAVKAAEQAVLDSVKETTDEIYARLEAGESFEDLVAEYGEDPGMQNEPTKTSGYYVSAESQNWEVNFRDAAMALEQVGQYTEQPVLSGSGVHIIQYTADVLGGEVGLDAVRETLYDATLEELQTAHCEDTVAAWVAQVNPVYNVEALEAAYGAEYGSNEKSPAYAGDFYACTGLGLPAA